MTAKFDREHALRVARAIHIAANEDAARDVTAVISAALARIDELERALRFYAYTDAAFIDNGERARAALGEK